MFLSSKAFAKSRTMKIQFLRHATMILEVNGIKILLDPMLSAKGAMDPVKISRNNDRIPLVDLPITMDKLQETVSTIDAVLVSHTHRDHWDVEAQEVIPKNVPLICQPSDFVTLEKQGFTNVIPINTSTDFKGIKIHRTGGQHGTGEIGLRMGHVSGFVIESGNLKLYIAGDTIWCTEVEDALEKFKPDFIILNSGAAQFDQGGPITMNEHDVLKVIASCPKARVINVHMDAVNHCSLSRQQLSDFLTKNSAKLNWTIPLDGESIALNV
jgi:L-ascorbate metabolism protein UlaG (beta-lactamase superfamily)